MSEARGTVEGHTHRLGLHTSREGTIREEVSREEDSREEDGREDLITNMNTLNVQDIEETQVIVQHNTSALTQLHNGDVIQLKKFNKIGGHTIIYKYDQYLIKQLDYENNIYELITQKHQTNHTYKQLQHFLPYYYGTIKLQILGDVQEFIIIEDLSNSLSEPNIIDLKMGTRQYGLKANDDKKLSQQRKCKYSTSLSLGVRLCGLQIIHNNRKTIYDKYYGRKLNSQEFCDHVWKFLIGMDEDEELLQFKLRVIIEQLELLEKILSGLDYYRFYGSSILIIYDNNAVRAKAKAEAEANSSKGSDSSNHSSNSSDLIKVKLIDFSKSFITTEEEFAKLGLKHSKDYGYLKGVSSLLGILKNRNTGPDPTGPSQRHPYEFDEYTSE